MLWELIRKGEKDIIVAQYKVVKGIYRRFDEKTGMRWEVLMMYNWRFEGDNSQDFRDVLPLEIIREGQTMWLIKYAIGHQITTRPENDLYDGKEVDIRHEWWTEVNIEDHGPHKMKPGSYRG